MGGGYGRESCCGSSFTIFSFSLVEEHTFVVVTKIFGFSFSLDLESPEDWQIYSGPSFPHVHRNCVTKNNLILAPEGASIFSDDSHGPKVEFSLSSYVSDSYYINRLIELVEHRACFCCTSGIRSCTMATLDFGHVKA